jgi:hypothetical protein
MSLSLDVAIFICLSPSLWEFFFLREFVGVHSYFITEICIDFHSYVEEAVYHAKGSSLILGEL